MWLTSLRMLLGFCVVTGIFYPLIVFGIGQAFFSKEAEGTLLVREGRVIGSELIAQKFEGPRYLHGRPSAGDFATLPAAASNLGPTSEKLAVQVKAQKARWGEAAPAELLFASGSGLDPHISPKAARMQLERISAALHLDQTQKQRLNTLVEDMTEGPELGFLGPPRVNVLKFNLKLDEMFP